jgi:2-(1,2-epoxy-1,2-dihydrophenyl)acetyl-CoA isomerase
VLSDVLIETVEDRVAILTLNRPDSLNALDTELMRELLAAVRRVSEDDRIGCVVLTGAGKGFCAGGDVKAIGKASAERVAGTTPKRQTTEGRVRWLRRSVEASRILHEMPKPTIAMINGACAGAGLSLAAACDFRFAADVAKFRAAFTTGGMPGDYGGSWLWTRILGPSKTRQLYLIDEKRSAEQALAFGLIDRIYTDADLREQTMAVAHQLAALPGQGVAYAKANLNAALTESFAASLDRESLNMMLARNALVEARKAEEAAKAAAEKVA